ncbi:MAG: hypothetical protein QOE41_2001 [Mycobacterium sp.]|jgi:hypothetical protein|nr:hypothetical protein [Mycobacterium sp.]MDT5132690.1 hypothetical protein [Mycobacterium sp.]
MKTAASPVLFAAGLATVSAILAAPAHADAWEPTPPTTAYAPGTPPADNAQTTVTNLQSSGYRVILNKIGALTLDKCAVTSVTPGQAVTTPVTAGARGIANQVLYTTIHVTADCTHPIASSSAGH